MARGALPENHGPENVKLLARERYDAPDRAVTELDIPRVSIPELIAEFVR